MKRSPPPLMTGDRLTRAEFERRSALLPEGKKVELLDGEVYVAAATKAEHGAPHNLLDTWLGNYAIATPGTKAINNATLKLDETSEPMPDVFLFVKEEAGGRARLDEDGYVTGPAELTAEIAASSASIDLNKKKAIYLRNGIQEYLVLAVHDEEVFWFALEGGAYVPIRPDAKGVLRSRAFPGLWLDAGALVRDDGAKVMKVLARGLATAAHKTFVKALALTMRARKKKGRS